jgi:Flp pilus assembly pilin Flp
VKLLLKNLWRDNEGQDIAEYALMLTVILLIVAATVSSIGTNAQSIFDNVATKLSNA